MLSEATATGNTQITSSISTGASTGQSNISFITKDEDTNEWGRAQFLAAAANNKVTFQHFAYKGDNLNDTGHRLGMKRISEGGGASVAIWERYDWNNDGYYSSIVFNNSSGSAAAPYTNATHGEAGISLRCGTSTGGNSMLDLHSATGNVSGSSVSTASFAHVHAVDEITVGGTTAATGEAIISTYSPDNTTTAGMKLSTETSEGERALHMQLISTNGTVFSNTMYGDLKIDGGSLGVNVNANSTDGRIDASNDVVAFSSSDIRFKENILPIQNALFKIQQLRGIEFDWKQLTEEEKKTLHGNEGHDVGVIAQEVEKVLPEVVQTRKTGYKAVKYEKIIPLLIEGIKEQQEQIDELKKEVEELKNGSSK